MIDRNLNYGRHIIHDLSLKLSKHMEEIQCLDIGAGSGTDLDIIKNTLPKSNTIAIESYLENVNLLRTKGHNAHQIDIERGRFPISNNSIDLVIANQILEHCKEIFWIFHEVSRVLKVGGTFLIGVPNLASLHSRLLLLFGYQPTCIRNNSAHIRGFTYSDFVVFLNSTFPNGYSITKVKGSNFYPFPPFLAKPLAKLFPLHSATIFLELKKTKEYDQSFIKFPAGLETNFYVGDD